MIWYFYKHRKTYTDKMEKEIIETYHFNPSDYDTNGRRKLDSVTFRDVIKDFERDFHSLHSTEYALNLYANTRTMNLLARSCDADSFLMYGMNLTQGKTFDAEKDPYINHQMDIHSKSVFVYGIDSAYMDNFDENGYPIIDENSEIYPLTLLVDDSMLDDVIKLTVPTIDGDKAILINVNVPKFEYV